MQKYAIQVYILFVLGVQANGIHAAQEQPTPVSSPSRTKKVRLWSIPYYPSFNIEDKNQLHQKSEFEQTQVDMKLADNALKYLIIDNRDKEILPQAKKARGEHK